VKERNEVVIKNAAVELYRDIPLAKGRAPEAVAATLAPVQPDRLIAEDVFKVLAQHVSEHPGLIEKTKTVFQFRLKNPDSVWTLDLKNGKGGCQPGDGGKADVILEMDEAHLGTVVTSSLADVQKLFFGGQLKISGNIMASNKLIVLQDIKPQRFDEARAKRLATGGSAAAGSVASAVPAADAGKPVVADIFGAIATYIEKTPGLGEKIKTVFQFHFSEPESRWVLDLKNGNGSVNTGTTDKPDVTLELTEANFIGMCTGAEDAQKLYFGGKLKVSGNVMASQKLAFLQKMDPQLVIDQIKTRVASDSKPVAAAGISASKREARAPAIFAALKARLEKDGKIEGLEQAVQFHVRDPESVWTVDFGASPPAMSAGENGKATTRISIDDADLSALVQGKAHLRELFQQGKLRVDGDMAPVHKLGFLSGLL
jgi:3-hydroxyacyl-CoA dehydrogenase/3a,7a,12a-trihydroxy-5b-cholest-24-enoyl-CoA hydratase